jgi:hypothetical protein
MADEERDAWSDIEAWAEESANHVELRPAGADQGRRVLEQLGVNTRSVLGAFALHAQVGLVDRGWVRILGAGGEGIESSLVSLGDKGAPLDLDDGLVIAADAIGGFFAVDGGGLGHDRGEVAHLSVDTLKWEGMGLGHGDFVRWLFDADLEAFYEDLRWPGWADEVAALTPDQGLHLYPPPWSEEGADVSKADRRAVPLRELFDLATEYRSQLGLG